MLDMQTGKQEAGKHLVGKQLVGKQLVGKQLAGMQLAGKQRGITLVIVLWMVTLFIIMAITYSRMTRTETALAANHVRAAQAGALAEAGISRAIVELLNPTRQEGSWRLDGTRYQYEHAGYPITVAIQAESGKISLNTAPEELLQGLLQSANVATKDARAVTQAILDWRDEDNLTRISGGAEDAEYAQAGLSYGAKDGFFNSLDELLRVEGMTLQLYDSIKSQLTIHSFEAGINPVFASRATLLALPLVTEVEVDEYLNQRAVQDTLQGTVQDGGTGRESWPPFHDKVEALLTGARGLSFSVTSESQMKGSRARIRAIIRLHLNSKLPYTIISWETLPARPVEEESPPDMS